MNSDKKIDILLATYNGAKFIEEQLNSIIKQTYINWKLIIRDDGSQDKTTEIIGEFINKYPDKIALITDDLGNVGVYQNFSQLLATSTAEYIMFCDQDDCWLPDKIELSLSKIKELESEHGKDLPLLVFTDVLITDAKLNIIAQSYWKFNKYNPEKAKQRNRLFVQNTILGCTMLFNRFLKELAEPVPEKIIFGHDGWLASCAATFGCIDFIDNRTMLYRQHDTNFSNSGKGRLTIKYKLAKIFTFYNNTQLKTDFLKSQQQAKTFIERYQKLLKPEELAEIKVLTDLNNYSFFRKRILILQLGFLKNGLFRNLGLLLRL